LFREPGFAATQHFAGELFKQIAGVNYAACAVPQLARSHQCGARQHADVLFDTVSALLARLQSGALKALA